MIIIINNISNNNNNSNTNQGIGKINNALIMNHQLSPHPTTAITTTKQFTHELTITASSSSAKEYHQQIEIEKVHHKRSNNIWVPLNMGLRY